MNTFSYLAWWSYVSGCQWEANTWKFCWSAVARSEPEQIDEHTIVPGVGGGAVVVKLVIRTQWSLRQHQWPAVASSCTANNGPHGASRDKQKLKTMTNGCRR